MCETVEAGPCYPCPRVLSDRVTHTLSHVANQICITNTWIERFIVCWKVNLPPIILTSLDLCQPGHILVRHRLEKAYPLLGPVIILMLVIHSRVRLALRNPPASCQTIRPHQSPSITRIIYFRRPHSLLCHAVGSTLTMVLQVIGHSIDPHLSLPDQADELMLAMIHQGGALLCANPLSVG
jgi:hypothetical protein